MDIEQEKKFNERVLDLRPLLEDLTKRYETYTPALKKTGAGKVKRQLIGSMITAVKLPRSKRLCFSVFLCRTAAAGHRQR